jgi:hypothetical protein
MKNLTVTIRTVVYSTYRFEVDDNYDPECPNQILEDHWDQFEGNNNVVDSEVNEENVEDWEIS